MKLSRQTFDELRGVIHGLCGLVLPEEKAYLVRHRLEPVVQAHGCHSFEEFAAKLRMKAGTQLTDAIIEAMTTKETSFFRDSHPFEAIRQHLLPRLGEILRSRKIHDSRQQGARVRLWCAAASTGQEPFSLAMLIHDYVTANYLLGITANDFAILATDISSTALSTARRAVYAERELTRGLTPQQISRYFDRSAHGWTVKEPLRALVEFRRLNLAQSFLNLGTFDLILCRNVLIYFDDSARRQICQQFSELLTTEGFLVLGSAESLYGVTDLFESFRCGESLVYRKKSLTPSEERLR